MYIHICAREKLLWIGNYVKKVNFFSPTLKLKNSMWKKSYFHFCIPWNVIFLMRKFARRKRPQVLCNEITIIIGFSTNRWSLWEWHDKICWRDNWKKYVSAFQSNFQNIFLYQININYVISVYLQWCSMTFLKCFYWILYLTSDSSQSYWLVKSKTIMDRGREGSPLPLFKHLEALGNDWKKFKKGW